MATVLVDAENVRRSLWPNMPGDELVERSKAWGEQEGHDVQVVWEGRSPATTRSPVSLNELDPPVWVVTSDRGCANACVITRSALSAAARSRGSCARR